MGPLSYMRSVVDRKVVMRRTPVLLSPLRSCFQKPSPNKKDLSFTSLQDNESTRRTTSVAPSHCVQKCQQTKTTLLISALRAIRGDRLAAH